MNILKTIARRAKACTYAVPPLLLAGFAMFLTFEIDDSRAAPANGTQTLVFLRHAEKPDQGLGQLNCQGLNRAIDLAELLPQRFGNADYVFAANPSRQVEEGDKDDSYSYIRPLMTISPSAIKLGLPVNIDYSVNDTSELAQELTRDKYHNATIYTAWSHGYLPELINRVAEEASGKRQRITEDWNGGDFDTLYVLTLTWHDGKATLQSQHYKQGLDNGAASCPT